MDLNDIWIALGIFAVLCCLIMCCICGDAATRVSDWRDQERIQHEINLRNRNTNPESGHQRVPYYQD